MKALEVHLSKERGEDPLKFPCMKGINVGKAHFYGSAEHSIDDKNRVTIPVHFRAGLGGHFYLCKGMNDKCLWILPEAEFFSLLDKMKERIPKSDRRGQRWIALFTESAVDRQMDRFNRISVPVFLQEYAGIKGKVKIYGHDERVEVWDIERWQEVMEEDFAELSTDMCEVYNI